MKFQQGRAAASCVSVGLALTVAAELPCGLEAFKQSTKTKVNWKHELS
jgi:hypothetical protein